MSFGDLICYEEVIRSKKWRDAMNVEIDAIVKNDTWQLIDALKKTKVIDMKWIYQTKLNENGEME